MPLITPQEAEAYTRRWELLRQVEVAELRRTSMDTKLRQLSVLMASRGLFGAERNRESEVRAVRERWARLRRAFGA